MFAQDTFRKELGFAICTDPIRMDLSSQSLHLEKPRPGTYGKAEWDFKINIT